MLKMIDVSDSQGPVDWKKVKAAGVRIVGVKVSEGQDFRARLGRSHVLAARAQGLVVMPYHYLRPRRDRHGAVEAAWAVKCARDAGWKVGRRGVWKGRDLPMCVDIERGGNERELGAMTPATFRGYVESFIAEVGRLTGRRCIVYLSPGFAAELDRRPKGGGVAWAAAWDAPDGHPPTPKGWRARLVLFHQTSEKGSIAGVAGPVDLDVFIGGTAALRALVAGVPLPKPGPAPAPAPKVMSTRDTQAALKRIGWPLPVTGVRDKQTVEAIRDFQRGFGRTALAVDGLVGPKTKAALEWSLAHDGRTTEHFQFREFASSRSGWIKVDRALVRGLEKLRAKLGRPIGVLSGYRDFSLGASNSQHRYGNAMDPTAPLGPPGPIAALRVFSGIGYDGKTGQVRHVDVRHRGPNTTGGTPQSPTIFADNF
jgi:GH25 family lysozyme M1 (1,4-beta-N-acetylmuramidase)